MNDAPFVDPGAVFPGTLLVLAPHMDDEVLACGGTIASLPEKTRVHVAFATDGARSPAQAPRWRTAGAVTGLPDVRRAEAQAALDTLGIPAANAHFLNFPDGELQKHHTPLYEALVGLIQHVQPVSLLVPFRFDRHPDHLALHAAAMMAGEATGDHVRILEYFVYYRWRLVPGGDVRRLIAPEHLIAVDITPQADRKRRALACYVSQTTRFFHWQTRAILPPARVADVSRTPELFLRTARGFPGATVFARMRHWVPIAHRLEPVLKRTKDRIAGIAATG